MKLLRKPCDFCARTRTVAQGEVQGETHAHTTPTICEECADMAISRFIAAKRKKDGR